MRVDMCRKCGIELRKFEQPEKCDICGKEFSQFICSQCNIVTDPQYHNHEANRFELALRNQEV